MSFSKRFSKTKLVNGRLSPNWSYRNSRMLLALIFLAFFAVALPNIWIEIFGSKYIEASATPEHRDFAIVLGASVHGDTLSDALHERMMKGLELQRSGVVDKVLISGDGTDQWYNETAAMERFALRNNMPREHLYIDQEGYNTLASLARAKNVFEVNSAYVISQDYHLTRAVWIARSYGIDAHGLPSNVQPTKLKPALREILVRTKDFYLLVPLLLFGIDLSTL